LPVTGKIRVAECARGEQVLVKLDLPRDRGPLKVYALFPRGGAGLFERFWTAAATPQEFRPGEQAALRALGRKLRRSPGPAVSLVKFLGSFAGPDFVLREYEPPAHDSSVAEYKVICDRIGHMQPARFTAFERKFRMLAKVGYGACVGRCGAGCGGEERRNGVYTQECLNHDACSYTTNENMGDCEDEFWQAADGYLNAPDCASLRGSE
jgi:hypothetical protein